MSWFSDTKPQRELLQVYVDDNTGAVTQAWTGLPGGVDDGARLSGRLRPPRQRLVHLAPALHPVRRARSSRGAAARSLLHLDLLVLLSFSVSLAFFNHAKIGLSVPLVYPPLIYLMVRMLLLANGRGVPRAAADTRCSRTRGWPSGRCS